MHVDWAYHIARDRDAGHIRFRIDSFDFQVACKRTRLLRLGDDFDLCNRLTGVGVIELRQCAMYRNEVRIAP